MISLARIIYDLCAPRAASPVSLASIRDARKRPLVRNHNGRFVKPYPVPTTHGASRIG